MKFKVVEEKDSDKMKFYRYNTQWNGWSFYGVDFIEEIWELEKETPCGYWITPHRNYYGPRDRKWVSKTSNKRYAYPSKKEAMNSLKARKKRQIEILESQLKLAKFTLRDIEAKKEEEDKDDPSNMWSY